MNDPERLLDGAGSDLGRSLLRAAWKNSRATGACVTPRWAYLPTVLVRIRSGLQYYWSSSILAPFFTTTP